MGTLGAFIIDNSSQRIQPLLRFLWIRFSQTLSLLICCHA